MFQEALLSRIGKNLKDIFVLTPYPSNDSFDLGNHDADQALARRKTDEISRKDHFSDIESRYRRSDRF